MFPGPSSRNAARLRSKRKLVKETYKEDSRGKADMRMNFHEPRKPTIAELQVNWHWSPTSYLNDSLVNANVLVRS